MLKAKQFGTIRGNTILYREGYELHGIVIQVSDETQDFLLSATSEQIEEFIAFNVRGTNGERVTL